MTSDKRGGGGAAPLDAAQDAAAFGLCRKRLERAVGRSCDPEEEWAARVAVAIRAALEFADAEPVAARVLTVHAAHRRLDGASAFAAMVEHFAALLAVGAPPTSRPVETAEDVVLRVARQTLLRLELQPGSSVAEIAPDLIMFALTPYTGFAVAQRLAGDG